MSQCIMCRAGLPSSCLTGSCESNPAPPLIESDPSPTGSMIINSEGDLVFPSEKSSEDRYGSSERHSDRFGDSGRNVLGSGSKSRDVHLKDQQSTGRKRAAKLFPINPTLPCEWRGKGNCGGGTQPVVGCLSGIQKDRHHGPDKSVMNNEQGNVHRICAFCHHRWHAVNDPTYDWNSTVFSPHNPRPHTPDEIDFISLDELRYKADKSKKRIKD